MEEQLLLVLFVILAGKASATDCVIDIQQWSLTNTDPLVVGSNFEFRYPDQNQKVTFRANEHIYIECPGGTLSDVTRKQTLPPGLYECQGVTTFKSLSSDLVVNFDDITCDASKGKMKNVVRAQKSSTLCLNGHSEWEIGYDISTGFLPINLVCFDDRNHRPIYSKYTLTKDLLHGHDIERDRPDNFFDTSGVYVNWVMKILYSYQQQQKSTNIQSLSETEYWNRGHLTANSDYVYRFQRYVTFDYINVAPQWIEFNNGNWDKFEKALRSFVAQAKVDGTVYTGTFDTAVVTDAGKEENLILNDGSKRHRREIPVPKWFWRYVKGVPNLDYVFLGFNNPFNAQSASAEFSKICYRDSDITTIFIMPDYVPGSATQGLMYACKIEDLVPGSDFTNMVHALKSTLENSGSIFYSKYMFLPFVLIHAYYRVFGSSV